MPQYLICDGMQIKKANGQSDSTSNNSTVHPFIVALMFSHFYFTLSLKYQLSINSQCVVSSAGLLTKCFKAPQGPHCPQNNVTNGLEKKKLNKNQV